MSQKENVNVSWEPTLPLEKNGMSSSALIATFSRLNIPTATFGIARVNPAWIPLGGDVEEGGIAEPVQRDQLLQRLEERERAAKVMPFILTSTSGFAPAAISNEM